MIFLVRARMNFCSICVPSGHSERSNFPGKFGEMLGSPGSFRKLGGPDSLPATRQKIISKLSAPNRAIWLRLRFVIPIANRRSLAIWNTVNLLSLTCCTGNRRSGSNGNLNRGSNHKSRDLKVRFELPETAIWGKFLRFGLRDFKSLAICDLWFGALGLQAKCSLRRSLEGPRIQAPDRNKESTASLPVNVEGA